MRSHEAGEIASTVANGESVEEPGDAGQALAQANVADDSVTVEALHRNRVVIRDEQLKREVVDALKEMVSDGGFKPHSPERRFD